LSNIENYSAKDLAKNNMNFGVFTKIEVSLAFEKVLINKDLDSQDYYLINKVNYDDKNDPISFNIIGSNNGELKDIPWDKKCIKKIIGYFCN
jgi:hypothetical protein